SMHSQLAALKAADHKSKRVDYRMACRTESMRQQKPPVRVGHLAHRPLSREERGNALSFRRFRSWAEHLVPSYRIARVKAGSPAGNEHLFLSVPSESLRPLPK